MPRVTSTSRTTPVARIQQQRIKLLLGKVTQPGAHPAEHIGRTSDGWDRGACPHR
jgi:hypothetical protein